MYDFYKVIGPQNVNGSIQPTRWPYTTHMVTPSGQVCGKIVGSTERRDGYEVKRYYLPNNAISRNDNLPDQT